MNKRVLDGGGLWKSDKLARIQPEWMRAEFANWIPLALANGVFEADSRRIWATIYSYNRPDISTEDVKEIKHEFCRVGLLFLWPDEGTGKVWAYFTGIDKPGRLPPRSRLDNKHEPIGPTPPANPLRSYVELTRSESLEASLVSQWLANGCLGFGFGTGLGTGLGINPARNATPSERSRRAVTGPLRQKSAPGDFRFQPFFSYAYESYKTKHGTPPIWTAKDRSGLKNLLRGQSPEALPVDRLETLWSNFLASTEPFTITQGDSLAYFCSNLGRFSDGPIIAVPRKGGINADQRTSENLAAAGLRAN